MPNGVRPTLISGFEDIVEYIQQQEQRIMALEEENKKLKELQTKADAWDIHCEGEWEDVSRSWSAEQCRDLISCGACQESDFQRHEAYNEE
jgi:hypothetical protein